jgi:anti-sigma factor RsiW
LLKDDLEQSERALLDAHLAECTACREKLNEFAGGDEKWWKVSSAQDDPEVEALLARLKPEESGERIGPYKLLQQIGEGGFGTVWMAEQNEPV